jgi:ligand-binding SRPBCC domain-containing protein
MAVLEKTVLIHGRTPQEVFAFCLDGANFPRIFPEPIWSIGKVDPQDLMIKAGREFQFLHWMLYCIPSKWRVRIAEVQPNERFIDEMISGPLRRFRHEHVVKPSAEGTLYTDRVEYIPYGGRFVEIMFLNGYMTHIFTARHRNMRKILEPQ